MRKLTIMAALAVALAHCACAELLTFTNAVKDSYGHYQWTADNWLTASGGHKVPAEDDDLLINTSISTFHGVAPRVYFKSVRIKKGIGYSGFSHHSPYMKEGGDGLVLEGGITGTKNCYGNMLLEGTVTINISNNLALTDSNGIIGGRSATSTGRFVKLGPSTLTSLGAANYWTGGTIREGTFQLNADSGKSGLDFHFDGYAASAWLTLGGNIDLRDGALTSTADLPTTGHGVNGSYTLTVSGTPKTNDMYFASTTRRRSSSRRRWRAARSPWRGASPPPREGSPSPTPSCAWRTARRSRRRRRSSSRRTAASWSLRTAQGRRRASSRCMVAERCRFLRA